jgi:hypothetical protein
MVDASTASSSSQASSVKTVGQYKNFSSHFYSSLIVFLQNYITLLLKSYLTNPCYKTKNLLLALADLE